MEYPKLRLPQAAYIEN